MTIIGIVAGILLLSLIMILHELGHFLVGKRLGFKIEQFSLFMGPVLFERVRNGVRFNIKAFPFGASVSFAGEYEAVEGQKETATDKNDPGLFGNKPRWARALVIAAGPAVNFVSALIAFALLFLAVGVAVPYQADIIPDSHVAMAGIEEGDRIHALDGQRIRTQYDLSLFEMMRDTDKSMTVDYLDQSDSQMKTVTFKPEVIDTRFMLGISYLTEGDQFTITNVDERSNNGDPVLKPNDRVVSIGGVAFSDGERVSKIIDQSKGEKLAVDIIRNGEAMTVEMAPVEMDVYRPIGIYMQASDSFGDALSQSIHTPWSIVKGSVKAMAMMFSGQLSAKENLTGPIGIVNMVGDVVTDQSRDLGMRFSQLLMLFGLISAAVGFTNLLPIPMLDGNHLVILAIEGTIRKDLPAKLKYAIAYVGFALIIGLAAFAVYIDIARLISS